MTENEAIEIIKYASAFNKENTPLEKALDMAMTALEEVRKYREIGTVEECWEAAEKQKSKSPTLEGDGYNEDGEMIYDTWICPSCGEYYEVDYDDYDFCPNCGQRILH